MWQTLKDHCPLLNSTCLVSPGRVESPPNFTLPWAASNAINWASGPQCQLAILYFFSPQCCIKATRLSFLDKNRFEEWSFDAAFGVSTLKGTFLKSGCVHAQDVASIPLLLPLNITSLRTLLLQSVLLRWPAKTHSYSQPKHTARKILKLHLDWTSVWVWM